MRSLAAGLVLLLSGAAGVSQAQIRVELHDNGTGAGPQALANALAGPHATIGPRATPYVVARGTSINQTLVIVGRTAIVEGTVHGDVIMVDADLFMHPGGAIDGRALGLSGGIYPSALARVDGGSRVFRDFTYDIADIPGGISLTYREIEPPPDHSLLAGLFGVLPPSYDRTDGLSLPVGLSIPVSSSELSVEPRVTYRSNLGRADPSISLSGDVGRAMLDASVGRGTFSNEDWIAGDLVNSLETLWGGEDARNYFRATRAQATIGQQWNVQTTVLTPYVGARYERDRNVGPGLLPSGGPWTLFHRHDRDDALRFNPRIDQGSIASFLAGGTLQWSDQGIVARARVDGEVGRLWSENRVSATTGSDFGQATLDGVIQFPTFGTQSIRVHAHALYSTETPRQRYSYLGGIGTLPTLELLSLGGDELLYLDSRYNIPLSVQLPLGLTPTVILREVLGGAAFGTMPELSQASGVRVALGALYGEWLVDPARRKAHFSYGLSIAR